MERIWSRPHGVSSLDGSDYWEYFGVRLVEHAGVYRHYPAILQDREYLERRPIGMAYEKVEGYEIIL